MKKLLLSALLLLPLSILSQELDKEYLESLPEGVREDLTSSIKAKTDLEKPVYRKASSMIDKEEEEFKTGLFGEDFFDTMQSSFMPTNEPNFDGSYVLDFGDVIQVQLIGQEDFIEEFSIKRDGSINVPEIGKIALAGKSLNEAASFIKAKVTSAYIGTEAFVSLTNIRDIQVLIVGNAFNPGIYTLNGNSNMIHAITMAGGVDKNGSYREIQHIRDDKIINTFDLYDTFIFGKSPSSIRLRSGDSILVKPTLKTISILSGVKRPGLYEVRDNETFMDVINFANGISSDADLEYIQLQRLSNNNIDIQKISLEDLSLKVPQNNDSLIIREYIYGDVLLTGSVKVPGKYKIRKGDTLRDLIIRSGGYDEFAYPFGGFLNNRKSLAINKEAKIRLYNQFLRNLVKNTGPASDDNSSSLPLILEQLRNTPDTGRVIAEFDIEYLKANPGYDTYLEDGDEIVIPSISQQVYIYGEVSNSGAVRYEPNKDANFYLDSAGGILETGEGQSLFVVQPNGKTERLNISSKRILNLTSRNTEILIYPGSIIFVPRSSDFVSSTQIASIWAPIISSLALSLASISSLNN